MTTTLCNLPSEADLARMAERFPELRPEAIRAMQGCLLVATTWFDIAERVCAGHALSSGRLVILMLLVSQPERPMTPTDIAAHCGITRATISGLLDKLARQRLIRRQACRQDHRFVYIRITEQGRQMLAQIEPIILRLMQHGVADLSDSQCASLTQSSTNIRHRLMHPPEYTPARSP